jgi:hypothetical protein
MGDSQLSPWVVLLDQTGVLSLMTGDEERALLDRLTKEGFGYMITARAQNPDVSNENLFAGIKGPAPERCIFMDVVRNVVEISALLGLHAIHFIPGENGNHKYVILERGTHSGREFEGDINFLGDLIRAIREGGWKDFKPAGQKAALEN